MSDIHYKNFEEFFKKTTGFEPYPYQKRFAESDIPPVLNIPTGAGKTEAAILGLWLWKRLNGENVPKRLVYCLPMRVLVEQTIARVTKWLENLGMTERISIELIMGGSEDKIQKIDPDKECIIIGTQDMLISGALNRSYGNSPSVWPIIFGLLNNDCMWIMDEVQIMENTLPTSIQLNHFRTCLKTFGPHKTIWMSATINPEWMETVDSPRGSLPVYELVDADINDKLKKRNNAPKTIHKAPITLKKEYNKKDVQELLKLHRKGTVTAIMVNTVKRAQELYRILEGEKMNCKLIHSRFRAADRKELNKDINKIIKNDEDVIIVSTQVLEAGVDISVKTMITELAPWPSLVQRFGRCNRDGKLSDANVYWIDLDKNVHPPYDTDDLKHAKDKLDQLTGKSISPGRLQSIKEPKLFDAVLRRRDIINLFDTTPDMSGNHTDVSRFVRNMDQQLDVGVFWRNKIDNKKDKFKPERDEICNVSIIDLKNFLQKNDKYGHVWNYANAEWERVYYNDIFPGQTVMLDSLVGGYSSTYGWDEKINEQVTVTEKSQHEAESHDGDQMSKSQIPVTLDDHTKHVLYELNHFLENISYLDDDIKDAIRTAAKYHDVGKTHHIFQEAMRKGINQEYQNKSKIWAKSQETSKYSIPGFRHEVASALAYLKQKDKQFKKLENLVAYLIISHHGKVRMSLRGFSKNRYTNQGKEYLLGIKIKGDTLPKFSCNDVSIEETSIDMSLANIGQDKSGNSSWTERAITLRDEYGPFCLAYLETLVRKADWLASANESEGKY